MPRFPSLSRLAGHYRRLHPVARIGAYILMSVLLGGLWAGLLWPLRSPTGGDGGPLFLALVLGGAYIVLMGLAILAWRWQGGSWRSLGVLDARWGRRLALGGLLGGATLAGLLAVEQAAGLLVWQDEAWAATGLGAVVASLGTALFFGASEELLFRGFLFGTLRRGHVPGAMPLSALVYALAHHAHFERPLWHLLPPLAGLFLMGSLLAASVRRTGSLYFAVGLHTSWVFVFLLADRQRFLLYPESTNWLTGGGYPPAGVLGLVLLAGLTLAVVTSRRRLR